MMSNVEVKASSLHDYVVKQEVRSLNEDVNVVSDTYNNYQRNGHLNFGFVELSKISPTRAGIAATTQAHHICPEVHLDIYVDKYDPSTNTWNQWRNWEYSAEDAQHITRNLEIIVQSGYSYSVRGVHVCIHDDVMESGNTQTDGLYIGITNKPVE